MTDQPPPRRRRGAVSDEDRRLWHYVMRDVVPMHAPAVPEVPPEPPAPADPEPPAVTLPIPILRAPAAPPAKPKPRDLKPGVLADLDRANAERFRRGELPIEGRLDLHGMTQDRAHDALIGFIAAGYAGGLRCLLVITGKGWRSGAGTPQGILHQSVPRWLNETPLRGKVLAMARAQPKHGGEGALYVLLKRKREERG